MSGYWIGKVIALAFVVIGAFTIGYGLADDGWGWAMPGAIFVIAIFGALAIVDTRQEYINARRERLTKQLAKLPPDSASVSVSGPPPP